VVPLRMEPSRVERSTEDYKLRDVLAVETSSL